ncbi:DUF6318 family protein [Nesterenkonia ebinurensis]|uniref:DUF6318 family protein n=1 Tax=Nesterenkonia ebinurensis TaxID=2608252 RepID=UPI00168A6770|nr:DUF6318 family protein [Nesterenkonia ebinurensis]
MTETRLPARVETVVLGSAAALVLVLTGCAGGAEADTPEPTVLESVPAAEGDDDAVPDLDPGEMDPDADDNEDGEDGESEPVPASSEGPARNWPVPEPPDEVYEPTEEGAEALIQHWFDVRHYARITGDTEPLEQFSADGCVICEQQVERVTEMFANGGWHMGKPDVVGDCYVRLESDNKATGLLSLIESEFETYWDGEFYSETEEDIERAFGFAAIYEGGHWKWVESNYIGEYDTSDVEEWDDDTAEGSGGGPDPLANFEGFNDMPLLFEPTFRAEGLRSLLLFGGAEEDDPIYEADANFWEDSAEVQLEIRQPGSESSEWIQVPGDGSVGGNSDGGSTGDGSGTGNQTGSGSSFYCVEGAGIDQACMEMLNAIGANVFQSLNCSITETGTSAISTIGSAAPSTFCAEDVPPQVSEEALEASVDTGPTLEEILAQIPGEVERAFSSLPIDGGSVSFEEQLQGFGYINRHTNVFATTDSQEFTVTLLGIPVEIRVVPSQYRFDYGDGTVRTTHHPGVSATESGALQADGSLVDVETPTSHIYTETGIYPVEVTTTFIGEYRLSDGAWTPISGTATVPASPGEADIWRLDHRHVSGECRDRSYWGCNGPIELEPGDRPPEIFADQYDESGNYTGP